MAAREGAYDHVDVEPRWRSFAYERDSVVVRAHEPSDPTVAKARGVEKRSQIGFAILRVKAFGRGETSCTVCSVRERLAPQIVPYFTQRRPLRSHAFALDEDDRMVEIINAIQHREAADGKVTVGPEY